MVLLTKKVELNKAESDVLSMKDLLLNSSKARPKGVGYLREDKGDNLMPNTNKEADTPVVHSDERGRYVTMKDIEKFVRKQELNRVMEAGYDTPQKILTATITELRGISGIGSETVNNIVKFAADIGCPLKDDTEHLEDSRFYLDEKLSRGKKSREETQ